MLGFDNARHLLTRTTLGPQLDQIERVAAMTKVRAVDTLLDSVHASPHTKPPSWVNDPPLSRAKRRQHQRLFRAQNRQRRRRIKAWWYQELLTTPSPLTERLVLMWHNHFTSSLKKVKAPALLFQQQTLFRQHALGKFPDLLRGIARDPAMLLYLDNQTNRRGHPNENFARELLELFTLGEGHYAEDDIKEIARAFSGWKVRRRQGTFHIARRQHDEGNKTIFGQTGPWDGDDVLRILLAKPRLYLHITERVCREFLAHPPPRADVQRWAKAFQKNKGDLRILLRTILLSDAFWASKERAARVKSPVELLVGLARQLNLKIDDPDQLMRLSRRLGQDLLDPPNVKGWVGGHAWITSQTLLARQQVLRRILRRHRQAMLPGADDTSTLSLPSDPKALSALLLARDPVTHPPRSGGPDAQVAWLLLDPTYHLN